LRETVSELLGMDEPRRSVAAMIAGLDVRYDLGDGHPLLGRRIPDLDLDTPDGPVRVFTLLHDVRPVLLDLGGPSGRGLSPWNDRLRVIGADAAGDWELPVVGRVTAPAAVLIRPDGYVAWVGDGTETGLRAALTSWVGSERSSR
jgi:3-(3-hydroxy-phenyl)propionate hydroxylase